MLLAAAPAFADQPPAFTCDGGPFSKAVTNKSLAEAFGGANVKRASAVDEEGYRYGYTKVFPNDPKKSVSVIWFDSSDRKGPHTIVVDSGAFWVGPRGVRVGMSVEELERANGRPFQFWNFNIDPSGMGAGEVSDWKGGALHQIMQGCALAVTLGVADQTAFTTKFPAVELMSNDQGVHGSGLAVRETKLLFEFGQ